MELNAHHRTQIYLWECLKKTTSPNYGNHTHILALHWRPIFHLTGTDQQRESFLEEINEVHPTIKFDSKFSKDEINVLNLRIYKDSNRKLATKVYTKPTDRQSYLYRTSAHPVHLKKVSLVDKHSA